MNTPASTNTQSGAAMLGIVLVIIVILLALVGALAIGPQLQNITTERQTVKRANVIVDAVRQYYLAREELPEPSSVPVDKLNLEQKNKFDAWGQEWEYGAAPSITGITVNGQNVAGVLISGGPDQARGTNIDDTSTPWELTTSGTEADEDDIIIPINVQAEAIQIARDEMEVLRHKIWVNACASPASAMPGIDYFGLGGTYAADPWSNSYILSSTGVISVGPDGIKNTSDDIFLPALTNVCPDGLPPLSTPIAKTDFEDIESGDKKVSFGTDDGTWESTNDLSDSTNSDTPNRSDFSLELDGDDYITIDGSGDDGSRYDFSLDQPFTLSIWVKFLDNGSQWVNLFSKYEDSTRRRGYQLIRHNDGSGNRIYFFLTSDISKGEQIRVHGDTDIMDVDNFGHWHLVTVTYDAECNDEDKVTDENIKIYIDGFEDGNTAVPSNPELDCQDKDVDISNDVPLRISGRADGRGNLNALIDGVAIYDKALDEDEVKDLYYLSSVIRYEFKGGLRDFSRNNRGGKFMHNGSSTSSNLPTYEKDRFKEEDSALEFIDNGVYVQNEGDSSFLNGLNKVTLECWVKSNRTDTDRGIVLGEHPPTRHDEFFSLRYDSSGFDSGNDNLIKGGLGGDSDPESNYQRIESEDNTQSDDWQQIVMTWKSRQEVKLYINGKQQDNAHIEEQNTPIDQLTNQDNFIVGLGAMDQDEDSGWDGIIDDVTIFPRVLSPAEIQKSWDNCVDDGECN